MDRPRYALERVEYWENSALDSRIYLVKLGYSTAPRNPVAGEHPVNVVESECDASSRHGTPET
jgi:hypothetical protein